MILINGEGLILGRLASFAAKQALQGEEVVIVNSEKVVITGKPELVIAKYKQAINRGNPFKGPFISRQPDKFLRRVIRGMLPWKKLKGRQAFKRVKCYYSIPEEFKDKQFTQVKQALLENSNAVDFITIKDLCTALGFKPRFERVLQKPAN